jgi:hypothetical protein
MYLEEKILSIVDNPAANFHDTDAMIKHIEQHRNDLNITASKEIIDAIVNSDYNAADSLGFPISEADKHFNNLAMFDFLEVPDELTLWAKENIDVNVGYVSIQVMYNGTTITPHIDEMRKYAYNYIISSGGEAQTSFYKPALKYLNYKSYARTIFPFDRIEEIEKIKIEERRWHRLDTSIIHGVSNLDTNKKRISLSLSFI